jgi:heme oxygenase
MVAAHRIQKKRGTNEFVDIGNDVKASNTDCIKKALQMYLNIADDVYRNQVEDLTLTDEQKNEILVIADEISEAKFNQIHELIKDQAINTANYNSSKLKLERELEKHNEKFES